MSCTSREICQLWNGQEIVRVMGQGSIREFTILIPEGNDETKGKMIAVTTSADADWPSGTGRFSVKEPQNVQKFVPRVLVMELKDAVKKKVIEKVEGGKKPLPQMIFSGSVHVINYPNLTLPSRAECSRTYLSQPNSTICLCGTNQEATRQEQSSEGSSAISYRQARAYRLRRPF
jgi:hypothetical protein